MTDFCGMGTAVQGYCMYVKLSLMAIIIQRRKGYFQGFKERIGSGFS